MFKYVLLCFLALTICVRTSQSNIRAKELSFCQADPPDEIDNSKSGKGKVEYSTSPKPKSWIIHVNKEEDVNHGILIQVSPFILVDSFLVIREVDTAAANTAKIQFVSGQSSNSIKSFNFFIPYSTSFYMEVCPEDANGDTVPGAFTVAYERSVPDFGEGPLPGEPPELEREKHAMEIQFKGKTPEEFTDKFFIIRFKEAVKSMARDHCLSNNIPFDVMKPVSDMVTIHSVHKCPIEWSDRHICVSVHHSVFVSGQHDSGERARIWDYQLTRQNLQKMWASATNKYLSEINLTIYEPPDRTDVIGNWFATVVLPLIILTILFYLLRSTYQYIVSDIRQHNSIITAESADAKRRRKSKLKPNEYQQLPSFLNEEKATHVKPGKRFQSPQNSYSAALLFSRLKVDDYP